MLHTMNAVCSLSRWSSSSCSSMSASSLSSLLTVIVAVVFGEIVAFNKIVVATDRGIVFIRVTVDLVRPRYAAAVAVPFVVVEVIAAITAMLILTSLFPCLSLPQLASA